MARQIILPLEGNSSVAVCALGEMVQRKFAGQTASDASLDVEEASAGRCLHRLASARRFVPPWLPCEPWGTRLCGTGASGGLRARPSQTSPRLGGLDAFRPMNHRLGTLPRPVRPKGVVGARGGAARKTPQPGSFNGETQTGSNDLIMHYPPPLSC